MRILLAIVVVAALGWSGFWYWNASMRDRALTGWLAERRAAGWVAEGTVRMTGFPNRVDAIMEGLDLADPGAGWAWQAAEFQLLSLSYKPHHLIAVWPGTQTAATPFDRVTIGSETLRGSLVFEPTPRLALDHATIEMRKVSLAGETGWTAGFEEALFSTRQATDGTAFGYEMDFNGKALALPEAWLAGVDRAGVLPETIDGAHLAGMLVFDRAWDRAAIEGENPGLRKLRIGEARFNWGKLDLRAAGTLVVDAEGFAEGRLDLEASNWKAMLEAAAQGGVIAPAVAGTLRGALDIYARMAGTGDRLAMPLDFRDGVTRLGPIAIGAAPRLARRRS